MGVGLTIWRIRIRTFNQVARSVRRIRGWTLPNTRLKLTYQLCVCLLTLLCTCGDIELNPRPPRQAKIQQPEARRLCQSYRQPPNDEQRLLQSTTQREAAEGVITCQRTISLYATPPQVTPPTASTSRSNTHDHQETESLYDFLTAMRLDITSQNEHVLSEINKVNSKCF